MNTIEVTVYWQADKTYCQACKPKGTSHQGTLVTSAYVVCCSGCGLSFREIGENDLIEFEEMCEQEAALEAALVAQPPMSDLEDFEGEGDEDAEGYDEYAEHNSNYLKDLGIRCGRLY